MARRNADQLDLLSYRPPRPAKPKRRKRRKLAAVKVKFGPSDAKHAMAGEHYNFDLLARRGSGDWRKVGMVTAEVDDVEDDLLSPRYVVTAYQGDLTGKVFRKAEKAGVSHEITAEVLAPRDSRWGRSQRRHKIDPNTTFRTTTEAKRAVKEWAAETLESIAWEG